MIYSWNYILHTVRLKNQARQDMLKPQGVIGLENTPANKTLPRKTLANFASFL